MERFGGADSTRLSDSLERADAPRAVLVPWSYDTTCRPVPWNYSAHWIRTGEPGTFRVRLRPQEEWVGGMPTFDAFPAVVTLYPSRLLPHVPFTEEDPDAAPALTAREFWKLYRALPTWGTVEQDPQAAADAIDGWAVAHPELVDRYPANKILPRVRRSIERRR